MVEADERKIKSTALKIPRSFLHGSLVNYAHSYTSLEALLKAQKVCMTLTAESFPKTVSV